MAVARIVPPTLEKRLDALAALRMLQAQDEDLIRQRQAAIAALRRDAAELQRVFAAFHRHFESECSELRRLFKYNHDQSRVPAVANERSITCASSAYQKAAADDPEHPGWPAGAADGKGGQFRPKDGNGVQSPTHSNDPNQDSAKPNVQYAPQSIALDVGTRTAATDGARHSQPQRPKNDDTGAAESGGKFENGPDLFNGSLHDKVMQYYKDQIMAGVSPELSPPGYHQYTTGWDLVCRTGDSCTLENARASVLAYQVPGYDGTVKGGETYPVTLPNIGYIGDVLVYDNDTSISNETLQKHLLFYGYVTNMLEVRPDGIYVQTIGEGVNTTEWLAQTNQLFGSSFFSQQHVLMRQHFDAHFGSSP